MITSHRPQSGLRAAVGAFATSIALLGCTVLTSELPSTLEQERRAPEGVHYYLPKAVVTLTLSLDRAAAAFSISQTAQGTVPDETHRYYMRHIPRPNYSDKLTITLGASRNFLKKIDVNTTDNSVEIIKNLSKLIGATGRGLETGEGTASEPLMSLTVDPSNPDDLNRAVRLFNAEVQTAARNEMKSACARSGEDKEARFIIDTVRRARCDTYKTIAADSAHIRLELKRAQSFGSKCDSPSPAGSSTPPSTAKPIKIKAADCSVGLCYRPALPYELCMSAGNAVTRSLLELPNTSRPLEIDIDRAFLVNKVQVIEFDEDTGLLTRMHVQKGSELLALSSIPLEVISALLDGVQLRINIIDAQIGAANASTQLLQKREELRDQQSKLEAAVAIARGNGPTARSFSGVVKAARPITQAGTLFDRTKTID